jgi:hypothetical protein
MLEAELGAHRSSVGQHCAASESSGPWISWLVDHVLKRAQTGFIGLLRFVRMITINQKCWQYSTVANWHRPNIPAKLY